MQRWISTLTIIGLFILTTAAFAQEATQEAPLEAEVTAEAPAALISPIPVDALPVLISARTDLELLVSNQLGMERPVGWSGSLDINNPQMGLLLRLDLELLVARLIGIEQRLPGWFGAASGSAYTIARDIRHDLELLADTLIAANVRPPGWTGGPPLMRCDRATQTLVDLLDDNGFVLAADPLNPEFCQQASLQSTQFIEANRAITTTVMNTSPSSSSSEAATASRALPPGSSIQASGNIAFAFLDRYATKRVGTIPVSEPFVPVARSYTQFSHMTLVQGNNFEVFVDYKTTTLTDSQFEALPNVNDFGANPVCDADWCQAVVIIATSANEGNRTRQLVNAGTNIVIYFDGGDSNGTTLVRMELCPQPTTSSRNGCQPVTSVVRGGVAVGSTGRVIDGIAQYRLPVEYSTTSVRTRDFYTNELWIAPPESR